jgi:hypothetical protein
MSFTSQSPERPLSARVWSRHSGRPPHPPTVIKLKDGADSVCIVAVNEYTELCQVIAQIRVDGVLELLPLDEDSAEKLGIPTEVCGDKKCKAHFVHLARQGITP